MKKLNKIFLVISGVATIGLLIGILLQQPQMYKPLALITAISLAIGLAAVPSLKGYQYTAWIISAVVAGMLFPEAFKNWGGVNLRDKTLILVIIQQRVGINRQRSFGGVVLSFFHYAADGVIADKYFSF